MNKLLRVLILLGIFLGLGISCASAASVISFNPQTVEVQAGSSQNVNIVMDSVPKGLSGSNITISVSDPKIAEITAVLIPDWGILNRKSTAPSNSVWIEAVDVSKKVNPGDKNVLLGTITLTGKMVGTTNLSILPTEIDDDNGDPINPVVIAGNVHNTAIGGSKKTPGFEIIYGLVSLLAVFLHKRK